MRNIRVQSGFMATLVFSALLTTLISIPAEARIADDDLVRVKAKKAKDLIQQYDAARTAEDKCVVFALDGDDFYRPYRVISLCITDKNKVYPAKVFIAETYSKPVGVAAVGQKDFPAGSPNPAAAAAGLVFILNYVIPTYDGLTLQMAKFDAKGKKIGSLVDFPRILAPSDRLFERPNIVAAKGKNSVGIAVSALVEDKQDYEEGAKVYFLETDFDGKIIRGPVELSLPDNGQLQSVMLGKPCLDGKWWRIPATTINYRNSSVSPTGLLVSGHTLLILSAKPKAKGYKSKAVKLEGDDQEIDKNTFSGLQFLPQSPNSGAVDPSADGELYLFYQFNKERMPTQDNPLYYDIDYFIQSTKKGRPQGDRVEVQIADWEPGLQRNPDEWMFSAELVSNIVADKEGKYVIALNRSINVGSYDTGVRPTLEGRWVDQLSWHRFLPNGQVDKSEYIWTGQNYESYRTTWHLSYVFNLSTYNHIFTSGKPGENATNHFIALMTDVSSESGDPQSSDVGIWKIPD